MTTATKTRKPRPKPARSIRLVCAPEGDLPGLVAIACGRDRDVYALRPLLADYGRGFELAKLNADPDAEVYHVNLDGPRSTCTCLGFERWGHRHPCKHIDGLVALLARQPAA